MNASEIVKLCEEWCKASVTPDGGMVVGGETERFRLLANGIVFHELNHDEICAALIGLSMVLLRPRLNSVIASDHRVIWSWCGELLLAPHARVFTSRQQQIQELFEIAIHSALAGCRRPTASSEERQAQREIEERQPRHALRLIRKSGLVLAYVAFPLLEAVLKRACAAYVRLDGTVLARFEVPRRSGTLRVYEPQTQCSSVRDLLHLHHLQVASQSLKILIDNFRSHLSFLDGSLDPFDLIYQWRNDSLHGSANYQTIGGTILNLAILISMYEIEADFEARRQQAVENVRWQMKFPTTNLWSFYPPY